MPSAETRRFYIELTDALVSEGSSAGSKLEMVAYSTNIGVLIIALLAPSVAESSSIEILRGQLALARWQITPVQLT